LEEKPTREPKRVGKKLHTPTTTNNDDNNNKKQKTRKGQPLKKSIQEQNKIDNATQNEMQ
jgi:hypothetical protein